MIERFERHYIPEPNSGCFLWTGAVQRGGYGVIGKDKPSKGNIAAHHASWELHRGPIPAGLCVLHRCDNPYCVNPEHLFVGTLADNNRDTRSKWRSGKLTEQQVREIRTTEFRYGMKKALAEKLGVTVHTIYNVRGDRTWKHMGE